MENVEKKYFVQMMFSDRTTAPALMAATEIINAVDMSDCSEIELQAWEPGKFGELTKLKILGCWHNPSDPLYIMVVRPDGTIAFDGYGTDH